MSELQHIILVESFFHPGRRHLLPKLYEALNQSQLKEVSKILVDQIRYLKNSRNREISVRFDNAGKKSLKRLFYFLVLHEKPLLSRLRVIRLRAGELSNSNASPTLPKKSRKQSAVSASDGAVST